MDFEVGIAAHAICQKSKCFLGDSYEAYGFTAKISKKRNK